MCKTFSCASGSFTTQTMASCAMCNVRISRMYKMQMPICVCVCMFEFDKNNFVMGIDKTVFRLLPLLFCTQRWNNRRIKLNGKLYTSTHVKSERLHTLTHNRIDNSSRFKLPSGRRIAAQNSALLRLCCEFWGSCIYAIE